MTTNPKIAVDMMSDSGEMYDPGMEACLADYRARHPDEDTWQPIGERSDRPGSIALDDCVGQTVWCLETWFTDSPDLDDPDHGLDDDEIARYDWWMSSEKAHEWAEIEIDSFRRHRTPEWMVRVTRCTVVRDRRSVITTLHREEVELMVDGEVGE